MHGLIDDFYEAAPDQNPVAPRPGDIYTDQPIYLPARHGLRLSNFDPTDESDIDFEITGRTEDIFNHPPLKKYDLPHGEAFILGRAKLRRPVIIVAKEGSELFPGPDVARVAGTVVCIPAYGADQLSVHQRERVRAYEFPNLFYLPQSSSPPFDEGYARLDHIQAIRINLLRPKTTRTRLSDDALQALQEWILHFLTGRLPKDSLLEIYRQEQLDDLSDDPNDT